VGNVVPVKHETKKQMEREQLFSPEVASRFDRETTFSDSTVHASMTCKGHFLPLLYGGYAAELAWMLSYKEHRSRNLIGRSIFGAMWIFGTRDW
jgi:hypothetical protein